ncbi:hypothetical protein PMZ80_010005 [Knufia obscura]|uniref:Uncharacterized protein n=1 Tax=Knufia obscura TaxID=1635080 RepID=A0ABR0RB57_9EURO|nr:hypothetical protein PMZ80_010005 [Knufia obscura]
MSNTNDPPAVPPVPRGSFEAIRESYQKKNGAILLRPEDVQAKLPLPTLHKFINDNPTPRDHKALDGYFGDELKTLAHNFFNCGDTTDYQHVVAYLKAKGDLFEVNVVYLLNCLEIEKKKTKDLVEKQISTLEELETRNKRTSAELKTGLANIRAAKVRLQRHTEDDPKLCSLLFGTAY